MSRYLLIQLSIKNSTRFTYWSEVAGHWNTGLANRQRRSPAFPTSRLTERGKYLVCVSVFFCQFSFLAFHLFVSDHCWIRYSCSIRKQFLTVAAFHCVAMLERQAKTSVPTARELEEKTRVLHYLIGTFRACKLVFKKKTTFFSL